MRIPANPQLPTQAELEAYDIYTAKYTQLVATAEANKEGTKYDNRDN